MRTVFGAMLKFSLCCVVFLVSIFIGTYISHLVFVEEPLDEPVPYAFDFEKK